MVPRTIPGKQHRTHRSYKSQEGFSYLFALFAIVLVGLSLMGANQQWTTIMQREREAELLFRGHQYRRAIASYVESMPGARQYPLTVDDLVKDPRNSKRHLRQAYLDPITNGPFIAVPCHDRIKGVHSSSDRITLKRDNFPPEYEDFRSTAFYRDWVFQYEPKAPAAVAPQPGQKGPVAVPPALAPIPC